MASEEIPWTLKGVSDEIRAMARQAAEQTGQTVGEWLSGVIRTVEAEERLAGMPGQGGAGSGIAPDEAIAELRAEIVRMTQRLDDVETKSEEAFARIMARLDQLGRQLDGGGSDTA